MSQNGIPWYRRPWVIALLFVVVALIAYLSYFLILVTKYSYQFNKRGTDVVIAEMERNKTQQSVAKLFAAKAGSATFDASRIEPTVIGPTLGNPNAKVRIVEFLDYDCPYSRKVDPVVQAYVNQHPDDVYVMLRDLPITELYPEAENVAIAAKCVWRQGEPSRFWRYHALLFGTQGTLNVGTLRGLASDIGADMKAYDACVSAKEPLAEIQKSVDDATALGLDGTPFFFFNGIPIAGAMDSETFGYIVGEALNMKQ